MTGILCSLIGGTTASATLDTQTVTRGQTTLGSDPYTNYSGYKASSPAIGSISDGTSNIYGGAAITALYFYEVGYITPPVGYQTRGLVLTISGATNSGWTSMKVGSTVFNRADAISFSSGTWEWSIDIPDAFTSGGDPFSASTTVIWT